MAELIEIMSGDRKKELISVGLDYIGDDLVGNVLVDTVVSREISGIDFESEPTKEGEKFVPPAVTSDLGVFADSRPGQTIRIGQRGYRLVIFRYSFDGGPGGHSGGHTPIFTNGFPPEYRANDGDYTNITIGPACGNITENVTVYTHDGQVGSGSGTGSIKIDGLVHLGTSSDYHLIGATSSHPTNHYVTPAAKTTLHAIARTYKQRTGDLLYYNDASLIWGGIFDLQGNFNTPHHEHRDGGKIDVAATETTLRNETVFVEILRNYTTNYIIEGSGGSRHYHVRF